MTSGEKRYGVTLIAITLIAVIIFLVANYIPMWLFMITITGLVFAALIFGTAWVIEGLRVSRQERLAREQMKHGSKGIKVG